MNPPERRAPFGFLAIVSSTVIAVDALTKLAAVRSLAAGPIDLVEGHLDLVLRKNPGAAWSLLYDAPAWFRRPFFIAVPILAAVALTVLYRRFGKESLRTRWGFALVLGGALGNLIDRLRDSAVVDFIRARAAWGGAMHEWPTFNVADVAVMAGGVLLAFGVRRTGS